MAPRSIVSPTLVSLLRGISCAAAFLLLCASPALAEDLDVAENTTWNAPVEADQWVSDHMLETYPLGILKEPPKGPKKEPATVTNGEGRP